MNFETLNYSSDLAIDACAHYLSTGKLTKRLGDSLVQNSSEEHFSVKCDRCHVETEHQGVHLFRLGGTSGEWILIFGELAEIKEEPIPLHVYMCPKCGKLELFAHEKAKTILRRRQKIGVTPKAFLKKCRKCGREIPIASEECPFCKSKQE